MALVLLATLTTLGSLSSQAFAEVPTAVNDLITKQLKSARSDMDYQVVGEAPLAGFYEVQVVGGPMLYVSADGSHFFDGSLYQVRPGQFVNIRDVRLSEERRDLFASRGTSDMIIFKPKGPTKAIMNVFTVAIAASCTKKSRSLTPWVSRCDIWHTQEPVFPQSLTIRLRQLGVPRTKMMY